jgi:hypothetical protein
MNRITFRVLSIRFLSITLAGLLTAAWGCIPARMEQAAGPDDSVPQDALYLLYKSRDEKCPVCQAGMRKKAFAELSRAFFPGKRISGRFLVQRDEDNVRFLYGRFPSWVTLRFHFKGRRWVGIADKDLSDPGLGAKVLSEPDGTWFTGSVVLVPYPYGDGPTFDWMPRSGMLEIHCRLEKMEPI